MFFCHDEKFIQARGQKRDELQTRASLRRRPSVHQLNNQTPQFHQLWVKLICVAFGRICEEASAVKPRVMFHRSRYHRDVYSEFMQTGYAVLFTVYFSNVDAGRLFYRSVNRGQFSTLYLFPFVFSVLWFLSDVWICFKDCLMCFFGGNHPDYCLTTSIV